MPTVVLNPSSLRLAVAGLLAALAACGGPDPRPTRSTCPPDSALTYDNFGAPFMAAYCTRCHASTLEGPARHGAPLFHDFDSKRGILNVGHHVDEYAAAGPAAVNELMPSDGLRPTLAERRQLGAWLACELQALEEPDAGIDATPAP